MCLYTDSVSLLNKLYLYNQKTKPEWTKIKSNTTSVYSYVSKSKK